MSLRVNKKSNPITVRSSPRQVTPEKRGIRSSSNSGQDKYSLVNPHRHHAFRAPSQDEMRAVFLMCRGNQWDSVLNSIRSNRMIATTNMTMDNNISTTILHQAITSKGDIKKRARVIQEILSISPHAATIKNGYGSLPLHVISQRNTKMDSKTKETLIRDLMDAYPESLIQQGGVGMRTPLHIIFTDYISPALTSTMIHYGRQACFMRDKKGFLPIHVACSRHCSPEKLEMLLRVNAASLFAKTDDGRSLLMLAKNTATKSHPNYALISEIERRLQMAASLSVSPSRGTNQFHIPPSGIDQDHTTNTSPFFHQTAASALNSDRVSASSPMSSVQRQRKSKRKRKATSTRRRGQKVFPPVSAVKQEAASAHEQRDASGREANLPVKQEQEDSEPASLLLHFSRHMENVTPV